MTSVNTGPVAFGWLRISRRELDAAKSTSWQPHHSHQRDLPLKPGEMVPVEIEILPTFCRLRPGEQLIDVVSGHDYGQYPEGTTICRHKNINKGTATVHFGGQYDSYLQLPAIPPALDSYMMCHKQKKMSMLARRVKGWSDKKFVEEYTGVHAKMTAEIASMIPILRGYTQIVACPSWNIPNDGLPVKDHADWDCMTSLSWSSLDGLRGSLSHPMYKASAGSHVFVDDTDTIGILSDSFGDFIFDPISYEQRTDGAMLAIMLAGTSSLEEENLDEVLAKRADKVRDSFAESQLLRYALGRRVLSVIAAIEFFQDSPFSTADCSTMVALEQCWFQTKEAALEFLQHNARAETLAAVPSGLDFERSMLIIGDENIVVSKDVGI